MTRRALVAAAVAALLPAAPGHAAGVRLPAPPPERAAAVALAGRLRDLPHEARLATVLARAAAVDGGTAVPLPARIAPVPAGVPHDLRAPLGRLLAAVEDATALARTATTGARDHRVTIAGGTASVVAPTVDRTRLATAAATVLAAIDAAELRALPARAARVSGCDVVDQAPLLCVGGPGANVHTGDYALQVDLGGDDTYAGATGGADPARNGLPVSVAIDLAGNDRYAVLQGSTTRSTAALGAARTGVGVLVDAAGDDSYAVRSGPRTEHTLGVVGIGSAVEGVGVHADLGGRDRYTAFSSANGASETAQQSENGATMTVIVLSPTWAIGAAEGGLAVQLDAGRTDDTYAVEARPAPFRKDGVWHPGRPLIRALGFGGAGTGLALDDGGRDAQTVRANVVRADGPARVAPFQAAVVEALGAGNLGTGAVVGGEGRTDRQSYAVLRVPSAQPHVALATLGASHAPAGTGLVADAGGDDFYKAWGAAEVVRATKYGRVAEGGLLFLDALGAATGGGTGAVVEAGGNDVYLAVGHDAANVRGSGRRTTTVAHAESVTHGASNNGGLGLLLDATGDDVYLTDTAFFAAGSQRTVESARHVGMGASSSGYGELSDLGGKDTYLARPYVSPAPPAGAWLAFLGAGGRSLGGVGVFVDAGGNDGFLPTPDQPAPCLGRRGGEHWVDCPNGMGYAGPVSIGAGAGVGVNT